MAEEIIIQGAGAIGIVLGFVAVLFVFFWMRGVAWNAYFAVAAKWYGWSKDEKFEREMARLRRIRLRKEARKERLAKRDEIATGDRDRRRFGVYIATCAIGGLAFQSHLPWWNAGGITVAAWVGLTMAAGLSFKW